MRWMKVINFVAKEWLHQSGGYPTFLTYDHNWYLEAVPEGTKVIQYEYYTGLYVLFWDPSPAQLAYEEYKISRQGLKLSPTRTRKRLTLTLGSEKP